MLATTFHSPATTPAFAFAIPGSTFLACRFASRLPLPRPVRPFAPSPIPGSPRVRPLRRSWPVAVSTTGVACRLTGLHSPSGSLHPSGSKRSAGLAASWPAFRNCPIPVRSPPLSLSLVTAADQRSRVATASETCCSSNLLEPHSLCSSSRISSMLRVSKNPRFRQIISALFLVDYGPLSVNPLWIKRRPAGLFLRYCRSCGVS